MNQTPAPEHPPFSRPAVLWFIALTVVSVLGLAWLALDRHRRDAPRRSALGTLGALQTALTASDPASVLKDIQAPAAVTVKSPAEQGRWITEVLRDEVSAEGLAALARQGRFGPVAELFPDEARRWADGAGVRVEECVAFRMERDGLRAEVVLHQSPAGLRVIRCNNVKQMAPPSKS